MSVNNDSGTQAATGRYVIPTFTEQTAYGTKSTDPYTKMFEDRIIFLGVQVDDTSANDVMAQLLTLEGLDPDRDIVMYINSPGGSYTAMTAIYDTMQYVRPDIMTVCLGQAASAAAIILAGGTKGKRMALPSSRVMIHQPALGSTQGQGTDLEIQAREILRMRAQMEELLAERTGQPLAKVTRDIDRDKIMTAEEAKEYGIVDVVLSSRKKSLQKAAQDAASAAAVS
jgi:ATP-dependent Clp protease protease subunit